MTLLLKQIFAFVKLLNSDTGTNQLASGIAFGLILGFSPFLSLQTFVVLVIVFFFRVQVGAAFLAAFFFKLIAYLFDPACDALGRYVLELESLKPTFTSLYNMPLVPLTRFYNSIVMGSGILGFLLTPIVFILAKILITKYRETILARFQQTKFWKLVQATSFYKWYAKYEELYG